MIRVQPIIFTANIDAWMRLLNALGMTPLSYEPGWKVFEADAGRIALHEGETSLVELWFDADDARPRALALSEAGDALKEINLGEGLTVWEVRFGVVRQCPTGLASAFQTRRRPGLAKV